MIELHVPFMHLQVDIGAFGFGRGIREAVKWGRVFDAVRGNGELWGRACVWGW